MYFAIWCRTSDSYNLFALSVKTFFFQTVIIYRIIQMFDKSQDDILDYSC